MPKYLMFDHGGVLDGSATQDTSQITEEDLVLKRYEWGGAQVLKNGVQIIALINELVNLYDYQLVFHSTNSKADQIELLKQLQAACIKKNLCFPDVYAMAVYDETNKQPSSVPQIIITNGIYTAIWGADQEDGKASLRRALESALTIKKEERQDHIVFDDGEINVATAKKEGYKACRIGDDAQRVSLDKALQMVVDMEKEQVLLADPLKVLKNDLLKKVDAYLFWREHKDTDDNRGYSLGFFTKWRHYTDFGKQRAEKLKIKLLDADPKQMLTVLKAHFSHDSRLNNHSLDTYLLEAVLEHKALFEIHDPFNLRHISQRMALLKQIRACTPDQEDSPTLN